MVPLEGLEGLPPNSLRLRSAKRATPLRPLRRLPRLQCALQCALGIVLTANKTGISLLLDIGFTTFSHSTPLHYAIRPWGLFFFFEPLPPLTRVCWGLGLG